MMPRTDGLFVRRTMTLRIVLLALLIATAVSGVAPRAVAGAADPGDANCDGDVNSADAAIILQFGAALLATLPCPGPADANASHRSNVRRRG